MVPVEHRALAASAALVGIMLIHGCAADEPGVVNSVIRDSAGVRIASNAPVQDRELSVDVEPILSLGETADGAPLFRVSAGVLLDDETIVIANGGTDELHFYSLDGSLRIRGGSGEGPGEFGSIGWLQAWGDTAIVVGDVALGRMTVVDRTGEYLGMTRWEVPFEQASTPGIIRGAGGPLSLLTDGRIIGFPAGAAHLDGLPGPLPARAAIRVYPPSTREASELDSVTVVTWYEAASRGGGPPFRALYGSAHLLHSARDDRVAYSDGLEHRIEVLDDGRRSLSIRERRSRIPFEPDSVPGGFGGAADSLPAYRALLVDREGRVWAGAPLRFGDALVEWRVFANTGEVLGHVRLPSDVEILDASDSLVLMLQRDSLDVETVELRRLEGPVGPGGG